MSQESVETLRQGLDAFNRRDRADWLRLYDPEVLNVPPREWPESAAIQGPEAVWDFYMDAQESWDEAIYEFSEVIAAGNDKIAAHQCAQMQGKASGAGVAWSYWPVFTLRDGKVLRSEWFTDRAEALKAAGLPGWHQVEIQWVIA